MVEHRMTGKRAEPADDTQHHRFRIDAFKFDLALAEIGLHAIKLAEKIVIPESPAEFAVGRGLKANVLLFSDDRVGLAILNGFEVVCGNIALLTS